MKRLQNIWKTQLVVKNGNEKMTNRWIRFKRGFYQGDNLSPVEFCITEIPLGRKLAHRPGYQLGPRNNRVPKVTHFFFIDDLKVVKAYEKKTTRTKHDSNRNKSRHRNDIRSIKMCGSRLCTREEK